MKIMVIGCGYLGSRVARLWRILGHHVYVTSRRAERADQFGKLGFDPVIADVTSPDTLKNLPPADVVLFAVGFDRNSDHDIRTVYVDGFQNVVKCLADRVKHLIYISSTGVLADSAGQWIDETGATAPTRQGSQAHLDAEQLLGDSRFSSRSTVLRLAGIYGPGRVPRLSAIANRDWQLLPNKGHVNLIHVEDAAAIANRVFELGLTDQLFHVSDGNPPKRKELYEYVASELGVGEIDWTKTTDAIVAMRSSSDKRISNRKLITATRYEYLYPNFRVGVRASLAQTKTADRL